MRRNVFLLSLTKVVLNPIILTFTPIVTAIGEAVQNHKHSKFKKLGKETLVNVDPRCRFYFLSSLIGFQLHNGIHLPKMLHWKELQEVQKYVLSLVSSLQPCFSL